MALLLDSHVLLWWLRNDKKLSRKLIQTISDSDEVYVSVAVIWELGIKVRKGKLDLEVDLVEGMQDSSFLSLAIQNQHALAEAQLPAIHNDPFDRIQIAQAQCEELTLVTHDHLIWQYPGVDLLKVQIK